MKCIYIFGLILTTLIILNCSKTVERMNVSYPGHWGEPPSSYWVQSHDYVQLPGNYGYGSITTAAWIQTNIENDEKNKPIIQRCMCVNQ